MSTVSFDRRGAGTPVVLVHGLGSRWQVFEPVIDALAEHHDVYSVDLPGFGKTPPDPAVAPGPIGYASWLRDHLADIGIERPHVVGNSMGGGIALELGRMGVASRVTAFSPIGFWKRPGLVWTRTLLISLRLAATYAGPLIAALNSNRVTRSLALGTLFGRPWAVTKADAELHVSGLVEGSAFPEASRSFRTYWVRPGDDHGHLREIPVTIAWGTRDVTLTHRTQSARARTALPFARHVDLPGLGHLPFSDDPALCASTVLADG